MALLALCGITSSAQNQSVEVESEYLRLVEQADSAIAASEYVEALDLLRDAMRLEPSNPSNILLLANSGMLQFYIGQDSLALSTLSMAHEVAPNSVTVLMNRARVNSALGNYSTAFTDYDRALQIDSTLIDAQVQKAVIQLRGGDVRGAEASLDAAEKLDEKNPDLWVARALLFSKTNRPAEAIPYLNRLLKKEPLSEYYAERAMCRLRTDDYIGASEDIGDGLAIDPDNPDLYIARALLNKLRYREKDSQADAQRALDRGASPAYLKALGLTLAKDAAQK